MIQGLHEVPYVALDDAEINQNPSLVKRYPFNVNLDFPIVSVQVFTLLAHHGQAVGGGKTGDDT